MIPGDEEDDNDNDDDDDGGDSNMCCYDGTMNNLGRVYCLAEWCTLESIQDANNEGAWVQIISVYIRRLNPSIKVWTMDRT